MVGLKSNRIGLNDSLPMSCMSVWCSTMLYSTCWDECFRRWCLCAVSQIWHHRSTVFCLFVFCFLFITLSALAEHLGIEFMGMNRSFLLVCRFVGLEAWACFLQLQLVSFCSWRDQTAITRWLEIDIIITLYNINAPDFRWLLRARFLGF